MHARERDRSRFPSCILGCDTRHFVSKLAGEFVKVSFLDGATLSRPLLYICQQIYLKTLIVGRNNLNRSKSGNCLLKYCAEDIDVGSKSFFEPSQFVINAESVLLGRGYEESILETARESVTVLYKCGNKR